MPAPAPDLERVTLEVKRGSPFRGTSLEVPPSTAPRMALAVQGGANVFDKRRNRGGTLPSPANFDSWARAGVMLCMALLLAGLAWS